jgi:hypothetical protein
LPQVSEPFGSSFLQFGQRRTFFALQRGHSTSIFTSGTGFFNGNRSDHITKTRTKKRNNTYSAGMAATPAKIRYRDTIRAMRTKRKPGLFVVRHDGALAFCLSSH